MDTITRINGNGKPYTTDLPKLVILDHTNETALNHITENTGLNFVKNGYDTYEAQPTNTKQVAALFMTYNFRTYYYNNASFKNTMFLKHMSKEGFSVESVCFECAKRNHINTHDLKPGDILGV